MKSADEFVRKNDETFNDQFESYKELNDIIKDKLSKKEVYDKLISEEKDNEENSELTFKEQWSLYCIVDDLIRRSSGDYIYLGVDLLKLRERLENVYKDVQKYVRITYNLKRYEENRHKLLKEDITFGFCDNDYFDGYGTDYHYFIRTENELKCLCCGKTTKDYQLTKEELDFLTLCADSKGLLLKEVTEEDLPLFKVLMDEKTYYRKKRKVLDPFEEDEDYDYMAEAEEQYLEDQAEMTNIHLKIVRAHLLDSQTYDREDIVVRNPKYLSEEKAKELLLEVEKEFERIQEIDSRFKELMIEECKTARYEILILSGMHIPTLLEQAVDEEDKIALTKAYYNISGSRFRHNSGYFDSENEASFYDCYTANPEINNRILEMKIRRI